MTQVHTARFGLGQIVRHRDHAFHGLVMDVDASYAGPAAETGVVASDQPFYRILVADMEGEVIAYAAEEALVATPEIEPCRPRMSGSGSPSTRAAATRPDRKGCNRRA